MEIIRYNIDIAIISFAISMIFDQNCDMIPEHKVKYKGWENHLVNVPGKCVFQPGFRNSIHAKFLE